MAISELCQNISFTNFPQVGTCFTEFVFYGSPDFAALILVGMFALIGVRAKLPLEIMFPGFIGIFFVFWLMSGSAWLLGLFLLSLVLSGIMFGLSFMDKMGRS